MTSVTTSRRLTMGDVDAVQVYAPAYFRWMDQGTHELLAALGNPVGGLLSAGFGTPVVSASCEYFSPVGLDDIVRCVTSLARVGTSSFDVLHEFCCGDRHIARGLMTHVWVDLRDDQRSAPVPDWLRGAVADGPVHEPAPTPGVSISECPSCGRVTFPVESPCIACGAVPAARRSGSAASLVTWTTVHKPPPGFDAPYVLAWVELIEPALPLLGRLVGTDTTSLHRGLRMRVSEASSDLVWVEVGQ